MSSDSPADRTTFPTDPRLDKLSLLWAQIGRNHPYIGHTDPDQIRRKLIDPSLATLPLLDVDRPLLDIGTGVGIPGLPFALVDGAPTVTLLEPRTACVALLRWLITRLQLEPAPDIQPVRLEDMDFSDLDPFQAITRATIGWDLLFSHLPEDAAPIIRWSGPDVPLPPDRPDWIARRIEINPPHSNETQQFIWWGPESLFHVKHSTLKDCSWLSFLPTS